MAVKVKMRYLSFDIATHFGSREKMETVHLSDNAVYDNLLDRLEEKYKMASKKLYGEKSKGKLLDTFVLLSGGKSLQTLRNKSITPDVEVLVAYVGLGG